TVRALAIAGVVAAARGFVLALAGTALRASRRLVRVVALVLGFGGTAAAAARGAAGRAALAGAVRTALRLVAATRIGAGGRGRLASTAVVGGFLRGTVAEPAEQA